MGSGQLSIHLQLHFLQDRGSLTNTGASSTSTKSERLGPDKYFDFDFDLDNISFNSSLAEYFEGSCQVIVKGRLKDNISFWQSIGASKFILGTLSSGYKILFSREPRSVFF